MKSFEIASVDQQVSLTIDISKLLKCDEIYFNATEMAKYFGKTPKDYLKTEQTQKYIQACCSRWDMNSNEIVKVKRGGKYQGTWMSSVLMLHFAEWLNPGLSISIAEYGERFLEEFGVNIFAPISKRFIYVASDGEITKVGITNHPYRRRRQIQNASGRILTHFDFFETGSAREYERKTLIHFQNQRLTGEWIDEEFKTVLSFVNKLVGSKQNEADLINRIVFGMSAKKYREIHGCDPRDGASAHELDMVRLLQISNTGFIEAGFDYQTRKEMLTKIFENNAPDKLTVIEPKDEKPKLEII